MRVSCDVMNSSSAGLPARVCAMPRLIAGTISAVLVLQTRTAPITLTTAKADVR